MMILNSLTSSCWTWAAIVIFPRKVGNSWTIHPVSCQLFFRFTLILISWWCFDDLTVMCPELAVILYDIYNDFGARGRYLGHDVLSNCIPQHSVRCNYLSMPVFQITASPSARSRQLWRRTGNFFQDFLQFYVYDLRFKAGGLTIFLTEFWTLSMP